MNTVKYLLHDTVGYKKRLGPDDLTRGGGREPSGCSGRLRARARGAPSGDGGRRLAMSIDI